MILNYYGLNVSFDIIEGRLNFIVIENPNVFLRFAEDSYEQMEKGNISLTLEQEGKDIAERITVLMSPLDIAFDKKALQKPLFARLAKELAENEKENEIAEAYGLLCRAVYSFLSESDLRLAFADELSPIELLKKLDVHICDEGGSLVERLMDYSETIVRLTGKNIFILMNLLPYLANDALDSLGKFAEYNGITYIMVNQYRRDNYVIDNEYIIDNDLCMIH